MILERKNYHEWQHTREFQQMIRSACEHFGEALLTKEERTRIFDAIRSGPPKEDFRERLGEKFTEERFQKRQHYFHLDSSLCTFRVCPIWGNIKLTFKS